MLLAGGGSHGLTTPIELCDLRLSCTLRVELINVAPVLPLLDGVSLTFLQRPSLDFSLKVARLDVMNIGPGDYNVTALVRHLLHNALCESILYPKRVIIPVGSKSENEVEEAAQKKRPVGIMHITFIRGTFVFFLGT